MLIPGGDAVTGWRADLTGMPNCSFRRVVDGDTLALSCQGERDLRARIVDYDTPEIFSPRCTSERLRGLAATAYLRGLLWTAGHIVIEPQGTDRYGRTLVRLRIDGLSAGTRLIRAGLARPYDGGRRESWCG